MFLHGPHIASFHRPGETGGAATGENLVYISRDQRPEGCYSVRVPSKLRWIDPLFRKNGGAVRISETSSAVRTEIEKLRSMDFDLWIYVPEGAEAAARFLQNM